jgi:hypothetical protein
MRKIHWLILGAAAALLVNAGSAAAAPNLKPAEKLCATQGGLFSFNLEIDTYACLGETHVWSERELRAPRRLCESAYRGTFAFGAGGGRLYECNNVPSL